MEPPHSDEDNNNYHRDDPKDSTPQDSTHNTGGSENNDSRSIWWSEMHINHRDPDANGVHLSDDQPFSYGKPPDYEILPGLMIESLTELTLDELIDKGLDLELEAFYCKYNKTAFNNITLSPVDLIHKFKKLNSMKIIIRN